MRRDRDENLIYRNDRVVEPPMDIGAGAAPLSNINAPLDPAQERLKNIESMLAQRRALSLQQQEKAQKALAENQVSQDDIKRVEEGERLGALFSGLASAANKIGGGGGDTSQFSQSMAQMGQAERGALERRQAAAGQAQKELAAAQDQSLEDQLLPTKLALQEGEIGAQKQMAEARGLDIQKGKLDVADKEIAAKVAKESNDPNSETTRSARQFYAGMVPQMAGAINNMTAAQLKNYNKDLFDVFQAQEMAKLKSKELAVTSDIARADKEAKLATDAKNREFEQSTRLASKYGDEQVVKTANEVQRAYGNILKAPKTAQGDIQRIYGIAKIYDPGSAVREGEIHLNQSAAAVLENMGIKVKNLGAGVFGIEKQLLSETQRGQLLESAKSILEESNQRLAEINKQYSDDAQYYGLKPERVIKAQPYSADGKKTAAGDDFGESELKKRGIIQSTGMK